MGLTRSVAFEEGPHGIRVNCICAGGVETLIFAKTTGASGSPELTRQVNAAVAATVSTVTALRRIGMAPELAAVPAWLASDDSAYVTGQAIVVRGGQTMGKALPDLPQGLTPS